MESRHMHMGRAQYPPLPSLLSVDLRSCICTCDKISQAFPLQAVKECRCMAKGWEQGYPARQTTDRFKIEGYRKRNLHNRCSDIGHQHSQCSMHRSSMSFASSENSTSFKTSMRVDQVTGLPLPASHSFKISVVICIPSSLCFPAIS